MPAIPKVLLAHPGTQYSHHLARELHCRAYLHSFHTCLALCSESVVAGWTWPLAKLLHIESHWQNRIVEGVPAARLRCYPQLEIAAWWRMRKHSAATQVLRVRNERFQTLISDDAIASSEMVIGFDTSSHILANRARLYGKKFILDRSIGHPRYYASVTQRLTHLFPEWVDAREAKLERELDLEEDEHRLADVIVVPSRFVAATLLQYGVPREKIRINPFGTDVKKFCSVMSLHQSTRLIFLFVGALTARKGLPLLLEAWKKVSPKKAELWIVGGGRVPENVRNTVDDGVRWLGRVSRERLPAIFQQADVFVCPSFFEGLAQVQVEAAASGLPIIATTASGGEEIVEDGRTGFVIEPGNLDELIESIVRFTRCPTLAHEMREHATKKRLGLSWSAYGDRWQKILQASFLSR